MWLLLHKALFVQRTPKDPLSFWLKKLVLKDADSGLDLLAEDTHTYALPGKRWAMMAILVFGEPIHHDRLEAEKNKSADGTEITKFLCFNHPSQKANKTILYVKDSFYTLHI